jgi:hypothetical protein
MLTAASYNFKIYGSKRCTPARQAEKLITLRPMAVSERCMK